MTITFPRPLPEDIEFHVTRFEPERAVAASRSRNRVGNHSQVADPAWVVELTSLPLRYAGRMKTEAWVQSLRGGLRTALYWHRLSCYPAAHPGDGGVAVDPGNLVSVADGNVLSVNSVNAGLTLTPGDLIGIEATHRAVGMVTEVSGTGTSRSITIEPEPPTDVAVPGAVIRFVKPTLVMRLVPGSLSTPEVRTGFWTVNFTLRESR
ncbi:MAG: hypothetical protein ACSHXI_06975 [Hoeflea sp.]|uniref:hypothetical protein n=1 Tax=Hoeflea sp. TaxID=1940281 RepID=UPI003EFA4B4E